PDSHTKQYTIQKGRKSGMTSQQYQMTLSDVLEEKSTSSRADFHVRHSALPETGGVLKIQGEHYSLKLHGQLKRSNHLIFYWKTSKGFSHTTKGELLEQSFKRWMNWGISSNGVCLTANSGEYHKIENEFSY